MSFCPTEPRTYFEVLGNTEFQFYVRAEKACVTTTVKPSLSPEPERDMDGALWEITVFVAKEAATDVQQYVSF